MRGKLSQKSIEVRSKGFNELRMENLSKEYTKQELLNLLKTKKISNDLAEYLIQQGEIIISKSEKGNKYYSFKGTPLYKGRIEAYYNGPKAQKPLTEEEKALKLVKNLGYQVRKCVGFDTKRFMAENPGLYEKYLIYKDM